MKRRNWVMGKRRRHVPDGEGFTGKDREDNLKKFFADTGNEKLWERLEETKKRLPWARKTIDSLKSYAEETGAMTDKQRGFATSLFIDSCVTRDDKLFEQVKTRKLGYRLMELELGRVRGLVIDIMYKADTRPFSLGQIRAFNNIAKRQQVKLTLTPKLTDETFDGWFLIQKEAEDKT